MSHAELDARLPTVDEIQRRLALIIPAAQDPQGWARRELAASLAWGTFVWFETEPDHIILLRGGAEEHTTSLASLLRS